MHTCTHIIIHAYTHIQLPEEIHDKWRPWFLRLVANPLSIWKRTAAALNTIVDPTLRELKTKQIQRAAAAADKEWKKLYECVYQDGMLYLWLWYPKFAQSAARCIGHVVGLHCKPPSDNVNDQFLLRCFTDCSTTILRLWEQFVMTEDEKQEIQKMSTTDCSSFTDVDMCSTFPYLNKFFFLKYDALPLANHYQEGLFSSRGTARRQNHSAERLDNQMQMKHNDLYTYTFRQDRISNCQPPAYCQRTHHELQEFTHHKSSMCSRRQTVQTVRRHRIITWKLCA